MRNLASRYRSMVSWKAHFDVLNRLDVTQECDRRTDGQSGTDITVSHFITLRGQKSTNPKSLFKFFTYDFTSNIKQYFAKQRARHIFS